MESSLAGAHDARESDGSTPVPTPVERSAPKVNECAADLVCQRHFGDAPRCAVRPPLPSGAFVSTFLTTC